MKDTIVVPLAPGFEEIEAVTIIDVLRRAGLEVVVAGLATGKLVGSHGIAISPDRSLDEIDASEVRMVVLPGGMPGTTNLAEDERVVRLLRKLHEAGRATAAICAAPLVLAEAGLLEGARATSHPSVRGRLGGAQVVDERVVRHGTVTTSQGPGTALEFALALVEELCGAETARGLAQDMLVADSVPR